MSRPSFSPQLTRALLRWFQQNARNLPWRQTRDPYKILLSEVMLQQTQVRRVIPKYREFLRRFPTIYHLAQSSKADVIRLWDGMGYNNRAVRLHQLATIVVEQYNGKIPSSTSELMSLPGIGRYTSHAIASFAFKQSVPLVDTNIERIFTRCFPHESKRFRSWDIAQALLPRRYTDRWNQALMELGSLICTPSSPLCHKCPWSRWCPKHIVPPPLRNKKRKEEPSLFGIPNRLYRGRILQYLREREKATIDEILTALQIGRGHYKWLVDLLKKMERDGIIELHTNAQQDNISLPQ